MGEEMKLYKIVGIVVLVLVLLSMTIGVALAAVEAISQPRMACYKPSLGPRACVKATFEWMYEDWIQERTSWVTKGSYDEWQIRQPARLKVEPEGWTTGVVGVSAGFAWYYQGHHVISKVCVVTADNFWGSLKTTTICR